MKKPNDNERTTILWLDHTQARITDKVETSEALEHISAGVDEHVRDPGEHSDTAVVGRWRSTTNESHKDARHNNQVHEFFDKLIERVRGADRILIMGPTTAPRELAHRMQERKDFVTSKIMVHSMDYKSDGQIIQAAFDYLKKEDPSFKTIREATLHRV